MEADTGRDTVVPPGAGLTAHQAAEVLNVSRTHLIALLEAQEIESRMVGARRRVRVGSLLDYKVRDDRRRREAADRLSASTRELGID